MKHDAESDRGATAGDRRVFISYRRDDCQSQANGLYDGLSHRVPSATFFMDIDSIPPGVDFEDHIRREIEICDLLLVLIGDDWLSIEADQGQPRIDDPDDFVRLEIENALASSRVRILPVLVEGARMPRAHELPQSLRRLARINAIELSDQRWASDLRRLASHIEQMLQEQMREAQQGEPAGTVAATDPGPGSGEAASPAVPRPPHTPAAPPARTRQATFAAAGSGSLVGWIMVALPIVTCGLLAFVPALWVASQRKDDKSLRRRMISWAVGIGLSTFTAFALLGSSPTDGDDVPVGTASDIGAALLLASVVAGTIVAFRHRRAKIVLPGTAQELARRRQREEYRRLIERDRSLARNINVGRPDLPRGFDDGGLLDLNSLSAEALAKFASVSPEDAHEIVAVRQRLGRLSSIDEITVYGNISEATTSRLKDTATFL